MNTHEPADDQVRYGVPVANGDNPDDVTLVPVLLTFANATKVRVLSGLAELSYLAGLAGDDEDEWYAEATDALVDAFGLREGSNLRRYDTAVAALQRAFDGGRAQREIDLANPTPPARSLEIAKAHALIYRDEVEFDCELSPRSIDSEVGRVARKIAARHAVTAAEAVMSAMEAFRAHGMPPSLAVAARALEWARIGECERLEQEARAKVREIAVSKEVAALIAEGAPA